MEAVLHGSQPGEDLPIWEATDLRVKGTGLSSGRPGAYKETLIAFQGVFWRDAETEMR